MLSRIFAPVLVAGGLALAGCADGALVGSNLTTASIDPAASKVDPACAPLTQQINALRSEGVADRVAKAAARKYKLTKGDLAKADELNKANADFQAKCATTTPPAQQSAAAGVSGAAANAVTAKATDIASDKVASGAAKATASAAQ